MAAIKEKQERERRVRREGFDSEKIMRVNPWQHWYRPDGKAILGQVDRYHFDLYTGKGWTLRPPKNPEPVLATATIMNQQVTDEDVLAGQGGAAETVEFTVPEGFKLVPVDQPSNFIEVDDPNYDPRNYPNEHLMPAVPDDAETLESHRHRMDPDENKCHVWFGDVQCDYVRQTPYKSRDDHPDNQENE